MRITYYFAAKVGLVKQVVEIGGATTTLRTGQIRGGEEVKRVLILSAACLLLAAPASTQPPTLPTEGDYFPLQKDTTWTYRAGRNEVLVRVAGEEKIGNETCSKLETSIGGMVVSTEYVTVRKDGVYRVKVGDQLVKPPLCFLKLPPKKDATWDVKSTVGVEEVSGRFKAGEAELPVTWDKGQKDKKLAVATSKTENMLANKQRLSLTYSLRRASASSSRRAASTAPRSALS